MAACLTVPPTPSLGNCCAMESQVPDNSEQGSSLSIKSGQSFDLERPQLNKAASMQSVHVGYVQLTFLASGFHDEVRQPAIQFHGVWVFQQTKRTFGLDSGTLIFLSSRQSVKVLSAHAVLRALLQVVHWFQILDGPGLVTKSSRSRSVVELPTAGRLFLSQKTSSQSRTSWLAGNGFVTA